MKKPEKMHKATRGKILAVLEEALRKAGQSIDLEFARLALKVLRKHAAPTDNLTTIIVSGVWAGVSRSLDDADEPTPEGLMKICEEMKTVPYAIKKPAATQFRAVVRQLPHPKGGRKRKLTDAKVIEVRHKLGQLDAEGYERVDALKQLAREYDVSVRTIQRAWQTRKQESISSS